MTDSLMKAFQADRDRSEYLSGKSAYQEFEDIYNIDEVGTINKQIDEVTNLVQEEAKRTGQFYIDWARNKTSQYNQLAELTQKGLKVAAFGKQYLDSQKALNDYYNSTEDRRRSFNIEDDEAFKAEGVLQAGVRIEADQTAKELKESGAPPEFVLDAQSVFGLLPLKADTRENTRKIVDQLPIYRAQLANLQMPAPDWYHTPGKMVALNELDPTDPLEAKLITYMNKNIDTLFLMGVQKLGLSKRELRKFVLRPMYNAHELRQTTLNKTLQDNIETASQLTSNVILVNAISNGEFDTAAMEIEIIEKKDDISKTAALTAYWDRIGNFVTQERITLEQFKTFGNHEIETSGGKMKMKDLGGGNAYRTVEATLQAAAVAKIDSKKAALESKKTQAVNEIIESGQYTNASGEKVDITPENINDVVESYKNLYGPNVDSRLLNYVNTVKSDNDGHYTKLIENAYNEANWIDPTWFMKINNLELRKKYRQEYEGKGLLREHVTNSNNDIVSIVAAQLPELANDRNKITDYRNTLSNLKVIFGNAYNASVTLQKGKGPVDYNLAYQMGINAVTAEVQKVKDNLKEKKGNHLAILGGEPVAEKEINWYVDKTVNNLYKDGNLDLLSKEPWQLGSYKNANNITEDTWLDLGHQWYEDSKGGELREDDERIAFYARFVKGKRLNLTNFVLGRLLATGRITKEQYDNAVVQGGPIYKTSTGETLATIDPFSRETSMVIDAVEVRDQDHCTDGYYVIYDGDKQVKEIVVGDKTYTSLEQMSLKDLNTYMKQNPTHTLGMFGLNRDNFLRLLKAAQEGGWDWRSARENQDQPGFFTPALQRQLAYYNLKAHLKRNREQNFSADISRTDFFGSISGMRLEDETNIEAINEAYAALYNLDIQYWRASSLLPVVLKEHLKRLEGMGKQP